MSARGITGKGVPPAPKWLLFVKIAILVLALICLALAAYALSVFGGYGNYNYIYGGSGAPGLVIFVAIKTFIVFGAAVALEIWAPHMFFRLAILIAYILSIIFWLSAWAWAASTASYYLSLVSLYPSSSYSSFTNSLKNAGGAMAACAALGAVAWILTIVTTFFFVRACMADPEGTGAHTSQQAELGQVPYKAQEAQAPVAGQQYPATGYQQVPYQQQQVPYQQQQAYGQPVYQQQQQPYPTQ